MYLSVDHVYLCIDHVYLCIEHVYLCVDSVYLCVAFELRQEEERIEIIYGRCIPLIQNTDYFSNISTFILYYSFHLQTLIFKL